MPKGEGKLIAQNKKARHDYHILKFFPEAGAGVAQYEFYKKE